MSIKNKKPNNDEHIWPIQAGAKRGTSLIQLLTRHARACLTQHMFSLFKFILSLSSEAVVVNIFLSLSVSAATMPNNVELAEQLCGLVRVCLRRLRSCRHAFDSLVSTDGWISVSGFLTVNRFYSALPIRFK
jgi:hypothetical protein